MNRDTFWHWDDKVIFDDATIAVWFSCGAASGVATKRTIERYGHRCTVRVINSPVQEEDEDNRRFLADVESWIGQKIEIAVNDKYPHASAIDVWEDRQYMCGIKGAPCTLELKKNARYQWEEKNKPDWHVLGFTEEEANRHSRFVITERPNVIPVLIDEGLSKADCFKILQDAGLKLPRIYTEFGYPNANCVGCVKATSPTYWNHVRNKHPFEFAERAKQSRRIGARLVKYQGKRIFLDELPADAKGRPMKNMNFECGIFCEITN